MRFLSNLIFIFLLSCTFISCSTYTSHTYKVKCERPFFLDNNYSSKDLLIEKVDKHISCSNFDKYKVTRYNINVVHNDSREFFFKKMEEFVYIKFREDRCELTFVRSLHGRVPDTTDSIEISHKYLYKPLIKLLDTSYSKTQYRSKNFKSQSDFEKKCSGI